MRVPCLTIAIRAPAHIMSLRRGLIHDHLRAEEAVVPAVLGADTLRWRA
jgi:hypothetical protein